MHVATHLSSLPGLISATSDGGAAAVPDIAGIRVEFILFALTLLGVAMFHHHTLKVALGGLVAILAFKLAYTDIDLMHHFVSGHTDAAGVHHEGEWKLLVNLLGLLLGFAILAKHFEDSHVPEVLPRYLPDGAMGGAALLGLVFVMSAFLDNIAAAMIGGTIAKVVYKGRLHIGYLAAIVAASNAGGAGSVVGDTTTTMLWISGVSPVQVLPAFIAAAAAWIVLTLFAAPAQHAYQPIVKDAPAGVSVDFGRLGIVALILIGAISTNVYLDFPALGVWAAILVGAALRPTGWHELPAALKGSVFLLALVVSASMMPVDRLPAPSWTTTLGLGFVSSIFDNIPLTKLAIQQGGYDWALLAYAVGYGGSMIWFGSSAGVAISNTFPEARSVMTWLRKGWFVAVAYVVGFFALYLTLGWNPTLPAGKAGPAGPSQESEAPSER